MMINFIKIIRTLKISMNNKNNNTKIMIGTISIIKSHKIIILIIMVYQFKYF